MTNMRIILTFIIGILCSLSVSAYTERNIITSHVADEAQLKEMLVKNQKWMPYPAYKDRQAWNKLLAGTASWYISKGEKNLNYEWKTFSDDDYAEYSKSGDTSTLQNKFYSNNDAIMYLFMAELAEGKGRFIPQLKKGLENAIQMKSWAFPADIAAIYKSPVPDVKKPVISLVAGEVADMYSWIYYLLKDEFSKKGSTIAPRLKEEIQKRILKPYMTRYWWWDGSRNYHGQMLNNWTPWNLSNILSIAMLIEDNPDTYAKIAYNTILGMDKYLNYISGDGACVEGQTYWQYAAGKTFDYLDMLKLATDGKVDLMNEELIKDMGEYIARTYVGDGWVVNFADASAKGEGMNPFLIFRYGKGVNSNLLMSFGASLDPQRNATPSYGYEALRTLRAIEILPEERSYKGKFVRPANSWYPEAEVCYMTTPQGLFYASKGGNNDESHNHNDIGTISLYIDQYPILLDAGVGTYTRQTFDDERYTIWNMQSGWHNVPIINGYEQSYGAQYKASKASSTENRFSVDIAGAYPKSANVNSWVRTSEIDGRELKVTETFDLKKTSKPNVINFLTWGDIDISEPGVVHINANGHKAELIYDSNVFKVSTTERQLTDKKLTNVWGSKLTRVSLTAKSKTQKGSYTYTIKGFPEGNP